MNRSKSGATLLSVPSALVLGVMGLTAVSSPAAGAVETCFGLTPTIVGTDGDDTIVGTDGVDVIVGLGGADTISGGYGDDTICAGPGIDVVYGDLHLLGELPGKDLLDGGPDNDTMYGDIGTGTGSRGSEEPGDDDTIYGSDGDDQLLGETGQDHVFGGAGNDDVRGNFGNDEVRGGTGDELSAVATTGSTTMSSTTIWSSAALAGTVFSATPKVIGPASEGSGVGSVCH